MDVRLREDPVRPGDRLKIRIKVGPRRTSIPGVKGGARHGVQDVVIHHEDLGIVQDKVETEMASWPVAVAMHERKRWDYIKAKAKNRVRGELPPEEEWGTLEPRLHDALKDIARSYKQPAGLKGHPENEFREIVGRGRKPLRPLEPEECAGLEMAGPGVAIVERLPGQMSREMELAAQLASSVSQHAGGNAVNAELLELVRTLQAKVETLEGKLTKKSSRAG